MEALLKKDAASANPTFPPGTKLLHAKLSHGTVTLDFNQQFDRLADMGDTNESNAQHDLCNALVAIPGVKMLRVTVEGKPFDSQMTDWYTPFSVHVGREDPDQTGSNQP